MLNYTRLNVDTAAAGAAAVGPPANVRYTDIMTRTLDAAIAKLATLPPEEQDCVGNWLLEELRDEERWNRQFAGSQDALSKLAAEALPTTPPVARLRSTQRSCASRTTPRFWRRTVSCRQKRENSLEKPTACSERTLNTPACSSRRSTTASPSTRFASRSPTELSVC